MRTSLAPLAQLEAPTGASTTYVARRQWVTMMDRLPSEQREALVLRYVVGFSVKEMAENEQMEIWLAPMGGVSVFTPIKILIGTKYGRFSAIPSFFGLVAAN